ncbi:hypothetical protein [Streptomyces sp. UNOC14_S4]|uniref:hypothetical protein n=1 Tax=Streptomyces sp. UNOC14_S4 TaxID=2872340 RepID=UPI001E50DFA3|nr:hypothetical protein [Streptomyces sp. UNOC14_S4]MCC3769912.1 hypothetical protein [Streptomyces sp. UNOC14_S4]
MESVPVPSPPVISLPLSSAIGSIHYVDCGECVSLLEARGRCRARDDEAGMRRIDADLTAHCAKRHAHERTPEWQPQHGDFAVDTSAGEPVAGQVVGWDGTEAILCTPGEKTPRHTAAFRRATVAEELSVKTALRHPWERAR